MSDWIKDHFSEFLKHTELPGGIFGLHQISQKKLSNARRTHQLDIHTDVYLLVDHTWLGGAENSTVVSERGLSYHKDGDVIRINWSAVSEVVRREDKYIFYLRNPQGGREYVTWDISLFENGTNEDYVHNLAVIFNRIAKAWRDHEAEYRRGLMELIEDCLREENWNDALELLDIYEKDVGLNINVFDYRAWANLEAGNIDKAWKEVIGVMEIVQAMEKPGQYSKNAVSASHTLARLNERERDVEMALWNYAFIKRNARNEALKQVSRQRFDELTKQLEEDITLIDAEDRVVLCISDPLPNHILPPFAFTLLPSAALGEQVTFPPGHPRQKTLYIEHPYKPFTYLPYENHAERLFRDRLLELSYVLQCLGAEEVSIEAAAGSSKKARHELQEAIALEGRVGVHAAGGGWERDRRSGSERDASSALALNQRFDPQRKPFIPEDELHWYAQEMGWQRVAQQRLSGELLEHEFTISSQETVRLSSEEREKLEGKFRNVVLGISGEVEEKRSGASVTSRANTWKVSVKFRPIELLEDATPKALPVEKDVQKETSLLLENEQEFVEVVQTCLNDEGTLSDDAERLIERWQARLDILPARAEELTQQVVQQSALTDDEREYLEEVEFCLSDDGVISASERRILERFAQKMGVSAERAAELEESLT